MSGSSGCARWELADDEHDGREAECGVAVVRAADNATGPGSTSPPPSTTSSASPHSTPNSPEPRQKPPARRPSLRAEQPTRPTTTPSQSNPQGLLFSIL